MVLHLWIIFVRLRTDKEDGDYLSQQIFNAFWSDLEKRLVDQIENPFLLGKIQKDAFSRYHGSLIAYDEGIVKGDFVLVAALFR